jgi:dTDP-4-amino-4,6-dideoxygalactose transaminase
MISLTDLKHRYQEEKIQLLKIFDNVAKSGNFILSDSVSNFEKKICKFTKSKYCVALNSGTDALMISLMMSGIKKGDEVITSPISFIATIGALIHIGAKPVFADVGNDLNINPNNIEKLINNKTKAIMPVHWGGRICKMDKIKNIAQKYNLKIIEDSAQALGGYFNKTHAGKFSDVAPFSVHPLKNLSSIGDGGFIITDKKNIYEKANLFRNHGLKERDNVITFGLNSRLDSLNAEILNFRLKKLKKIIDQRRKNVDLYLRFLKTKKIRLNISENKNENTYVMLLGLCEKRDKLKHFLQKKNIQSLIYYGTPLHLHPASKAFNVKFKKGLLPVAEKFCSKVLALPVHQYLKSREIKYICDIINNFYE